MIIIKEKVWKIDRAYAMIIYTFLQDSIIASFNDD